ncbi:MULTISPECIES: helix-turn-helix domain-containing protein [Acinetobacter]|uniref:Helix-turn-helix domain-containing protein n=1 Tax=Acinetobacter corruptisaponis TaxID=3045147 RepID=A0ABY8S3T6_9GAMM|nr:MULTISPECIES: helix-turn-helix domain-containing protein [Acinetobacter]MDH0030948.1 helix-turn-helix domain-containing protein [Acinetobacter sp. GD04021]MDH0886520.1 helix-turn-helix domain-containing protein [Acinetobacter sp. GD03873]MDH1083042.1 helix-turn-helix domain-containing protein [Acinetobacter sp. GD03983]MDH2189997.1 helix-turn-helix domain-containing protein [Acinetobacter sp. GD03645]MDH2203221.1 helix-turn-helix domain-containing protein [Acinetobacter sp. GD03647]
MLVVEPDVNSGLLHAFQIRESLQHTQILKDWSLSYNQLSSGHFESHLNELWLDDIQIYEEKISPSIFQSGEGKADSLCLGVFSNLSDPALWMGQALQGSEIISLCQGGEIMMRTPPQSSFLSLSLPMSLLAEAGEIPQGASMLTHQPLAQEIYCKLSVLLNQLSRLHTTNLASMQQAKSEILDLGFQYVQALQQQRNEIRTSARKAKIVVQRALDAMQSCHDNPPTMDELCQLTYTSRRTLQNCFELITGQSPAQFLKHLRLNGVRRTFIQNAESVSVSEVASEWGFWHLSQFATDYKKLFGETPSQTLAQCK